MMMFGQLQVKGFQNDDGSIELELLKGDFSERLPNCKEDLLSEAFDLFAEIVNELLDVEFLVLELGHFLIFSI